jgi:hypothetical protein
MHNGGCGLYFADSGKFLNKMLKQSMLAFSALYKILSPIGLILVVRLRVRETVPTLPKMLIVYCSIKH